MEQLAMGGYGAYVWSAFSLTFIVLVGCGVRARWRHRDIYNHIRTRLEAMETKE